MANPKANPRIKNTLLSIIVFLKHKAEDKNLKPVITVAKLIDMLRSSGIKLNYQQLLDLTKNPFIAPSIKSINKNQIEFNLGDEEEPSEFGLENASSTDQPEQEEGGEEQESSDEDGEYNPEDFEMPEDEETPENTVEPEAAPKQKESMVTAMAKRAAQRPD